MGSGSREADVWVGYGEEFRRLFCETERGRGGKRSGETSLPRRIPRRCVLTCRIPRRLPRGEVCIRS